MPFFAVYIVKTMTYDRIGLCENKKCPQLATKGKFNNLYF